jgi:hypothetical protein
MYIVFLAENRTCFDASCWSVEVINGGGGVRFGFVTRKEVTLNFVPFLRVVLNRSNSFLFAIFLRSPSIRQSFPRNFSSRSVVKSASATQYGIDLKEVISFSRSDTSRSATLWTRPADNPPLMIFQSIGLV